MQPWEFVRLALLACGGKIEGTAKLQKTIYFLGLMTGQQEMLDYQRHYFGPISHEVDNGLSDLRGFGYATSWVGSVPARTDPQAFEDRRFDHMLTEEGVRAAERTAEEYPELYEQLKAGVEKLRQAGDLDYIHLAIAAKIHFLLGMWGGSPDESELPQLVKCFGWPVSGEQLRSGLAFLRKLNLPACVSA